ncbi:MAG: Smr/MutS family protein [Polyangiaceae bacterium]
MGSKRDSGSGFKELFERSLDESPVSLPESSSPDRGLSFADVAKGLGARPLPDVPAKIDAPASQVTKVSRFVGDDEDLSPPPRFVVDDLDGWLEGRREGMPKNDRRTLRRASFGATVDLHGMVASEAERALHRFIVRSHRQGVRHLRVIVGKGKHSPTGRGVLRGQIASWLTDPPSAHHIRSFVSAAMRDGGDGVLLISLQ